MQRIILNIVLMTLILLLFAGIAYDAPSSTYWTPMTPDIQSYGVLHVGIADYFTVDKKASEGGNQTFPTI